MLETSLEKRAESDAIPVRLALSKLKYKYSITLEIAAGNLLRFQGCFCCLGKHHQITRKNLKKTT